jgi:tRNA G18 (ribose-2'-O)-methylase SpoU
MVDRLTGMRRRACRDIEEGMAEFVRVLGAADPRLADYVDLRDVSLRKHLEAAHGLFIAEGEKVVRRALEAGHSPRSFLLAPRWLDGLADVLESTDAVCFVAEEQVTEQLTGFHVHRGALASLHRAPLPAVDDVLASATRVVVLEDLVDHTNVGAIFRNAAALGFDAAVLAPRCADPLYRRAIKVSMGTVFSLPYARFDDWAGAMNLLRAHGFTSLALTPGEGSVDLASLAVPARCALVIGAEGDGLSERWLRSADVQVSIRMTAGIDSLNVAAATAVAAYALGPASRP